MFSIVLVVVAHEQNNTKNIQNISLYYSSVSDKFKKYMVAKKILLLLWNLIFDLDPVLKVIFNRTFLQYKVSSYLLLFLRTLQKTFNSDPAAITICQLNLDLI